MNEVEDSQTLPCFLRDLDFPKHFRTQANAMTNWFRQDSSICFRRWKTSLQFNTPLSQEVSPTISGPCFLSSFHIWVYSVTTEW